MILEFFAVFFCLSVLLLCGFGFAAAAGSAGRKIQEGAALAPAFGLALFGFLGFAVYRWAGPLGGSALIATAAVAGCSVILVVARRVPFSFPDKRAASLGLTLGIAAAALAAAPLIAGGIQWAAFGTNPSDAYFFQSFAATIQNADWKTLLGGAGSIAEAGEGVRKLVQTAPASLFTARFVNLPLTLGNSAALAWVSTLAGASPHRFYTAYNLICLIAAVPAAYTIARDCGLSRPIAYGTAGAVSLGYWANHVLRSDSSAQIFTVPVSLLLAALWIRAASAARFTAAHAGLAVAAAALLASNPAFPPLLGPAFALFAASAAFAKRFTAKDLALYAGAGALALALLAATGQADYLARCYAKFFYFVKSRTYAYDPGVFTTALGNDFFTGAWGLRPVADFGILPKAALEPALHVFGIALSGLAVLGVAGGLGRNASPARRVVASIAAASWITSLATLANKNYFSAMMAFEYAYPFFMIAAAAAAVSIKSAGARKAAMIAVAALLAVQCLLGLRWVREAAKESAPGKGWMKPEQYDVTEITRELENRYPRLVYVDVPAEGTAWPFPVYLTLEFASLNAHHARGSVYDNRPDGVHAVLPLSGMPDYAVVRRSADRIGPSGTGKEIVSTKDLVLYQITGGTPADFTGAN